MIGVEKLRKGIVSSDGLRFLSTAASAEIEQLIGDPLLRKVVAGTSFLYDGIRGHSPFYHHAMINHSFIRGAYRFAGGSQQLADALCDVIRRNGGEVRCGDAVGKIRLRENRVTVVKTVSGEVLEAGAVLSDIHPARLLPMLDKDNRIRPSYAARIGSVPNSCGVFSVFATVDKKAFPYRNQNHYIIDGDDVWAEREGAPRPQMVMLSMQAQGGQRSLRSRFAAVPHVVRGGGEMGGYGHRKTRRGIRSVQAGKGRSRHPKRRGPFPGIPRGDPEHSHGDAADIRGLHGTPQGSAYGMQIDCNDVLGTSFSPETKVGGLYLTGQNIAIHGALGVVMTAISTCGALLGREYTARKIGNSQGE